MESKTCLVHFGHNSQPLEILYGFESFFENHIWVLFDQEEIRKHRWMRNPALLINSFFMFGSDPGEVWHAVETFGSLMSVTSLLLREERSSLTVLWWVHENEKNRTKDNKLAWVQFFCTPISFRLLVLLPLDSTAYINKLNLHLRSQRLEVTKAFAMVDYHVRDNGCKGFLY